MLLWCFKTYVSPNGRRDAQHTIDRYNDSDQAFFSRAVAHLATTTIDQWHEPHGKKLKNEKPLFEVRYKANRCATRALGFFGSDGASFIIVLICTHKQDIYDPPDAFKTAHRRISQVLSGSAQTVPLQIDGEDFPSYED